MSVPATTRLSAPTYDYAAVRAIASQLDLPEPVAVTLVRRGFSTPESAAEFLAASERHDPLAFEDMAAVCDLVGEAVEAGAKVTVHGDYDVDGVTSTAILVECLRGLGAECDWFIPDRMGDGYGLTAETVETLAARGTEVLITVDCGIGSAAEVARARELGLEVVVTDHHKPPETLPDCPILHPELSGYPFPSLCAAGVAHKLAHALRSRRGFTSGAQSPESDLVALATVADMVPLTGENRRLVREGLVALRRTERPGLRALMAVSKTDPATVTESEIAFRLAPRINAAGRLYRADAGVELLLTDSDGRAAEIADELNRANSERRAVERRVRDGAEREARELPGDEERAALVLAGEDWHPGVVGIVASRLVEAHRVPVVLIAVADGVGKGSARSVPGYDLVAGLDACSTHLRRHGGHAAAAGLELDESEIPAFREAFEAHARATVDPAALPEERIDALVGVGAGPAGLGLDLAEGFERLAPFGMANPSPTLLVPAGVMREVRPLGEEGKHSRFRVHAGAGSAPGVAFGVNGSLAGHEDEPVDLAVRLEVDHWHGAAQPRVVLRSMRADAAEPADEGAGESEPAPGCGSASCPAPSGEWWDRFASALERGPATAATGEAEPGGPLREAVDRRGGASLAAITELVSSGEGVLAICADASRRRDLPARVADPRRFGTPAPAICCERCGQAAINSNPLLAPATGSEADPSGPGFALTDWATVERSGAASLPARHVVLVDPPVSASGRSIAAAAMSAPWRSAPFAAGFVHLAWGKGEVELSERLLGARWLLRTPIAAIFRALRDVGGEVGGDELRSILTGPGAHGRSPETAAHCVAVLRELGLCAAGGSGTETTLAIASSERADLEDSSVFRACAQEHARALAELARADNRGGVPLTDHGGQ